VKPYYEHGGITIYHGDCREVLPTLGPVDHVITDPPYGIGYSTGYRTGVVRSSTRLINDLLVAPLLNDTFAAMAPLLNDTAAVYVFAAPLKLDEVLRVLRSFWDVANVLCWDKGNCTAGDLATTYGQRWEAIVYARRGRPAFKRRDRDVLAFSRGNSRRYLHPTQKPISLLRYLIERHPDASVVLDPFMGSGTTLCAAKDIGRKAIGIEIEERYCEIAAKRLEQQVLPGVAS
jgi:site-specific DNA-methyltransferase (adenine-specific)